MDTGKPLFFSLDTFFALVDMYISADEVETALYLLDHLPAYYRDRPPKRLLETKQDLHRQLWTPSQYKGIYDSVENASEWPYRAQVLEDVIKKIDAPVHIMEFGPGSMFIRNGLDKRGYAYSYEYISLDKSELAETTNGCNMFVCFETIEHLSNPFEIYQNYLKFGKTADYVLCSTPLYTYGGGMGLEWRNRPLGHLRTYTPSEFHASLSKMFIGYEWSCHMHDTITMVGKKT